MSRLTYEFVVNKGKGQILKRVLQENKARHIFQETITSYPLICIRAYQEVRNFRSSENLA